MTRDIVKSMVFSDTVFDVVIDKKLQSSTIDDHCFCDWVLNIICNFKMCPDYYPIDYEPVGLYDVAKYIFDQKKLWSFGVDEEAFADEVIAHFVDMGKVPDRFYVCE